MTAQLPRVGDIFIDRYELVRIVGFGGSARIYEARQQDIDRRVALKIIAPPSKGEDDLRAETFAERFEREAKAISQLQDPHTVTLHDHGECDGLLYMVLEFIDGRTLKDVLKAEGAMEPERVIRVLDQVLQSLAEAHNHGLIHRDIKPSNIMLYEHMGEQDQVKLLDFGLVKSVTGEQLVDPDNLTQADVLLGTPRYMSPEQIHQAPTTASSDIYSLGLVGVEMLTGEALITDQSAMAVISKHIDPQEFDLSEVPAPRPLHATITTMVRKDPTLRFASAREALDALYTEPAPEPAPAPVPAPTPRWRKVAPIAAGVVPVLVAVLVPLVSSMRSTESVAVTPVSEEQIEPPPALAQDVGNEPDATASSWDFGLAAAEPQVDPELHRQRASALGWAVVRVGAAGEAALGEVDSELERRKRKRRRRKHVRDARNQDGKRDLKIFEP